MTVEQRQYQWLRWSLLAGGLAILIGLAVASWRLWPAVTQSWQAKQLGCGCARVVVSTSPWLRVTGLITLAITFWLIGRWLVAFGQQLHRSRRIQAEFTTAGYRDVSHPRVQLAYRVYRGQRLVAMTVGFLRPRIYVSVALIKELTAGELEAVLRHEAHHVRAFDPLVMAGLASLGDALGWWPMIRHWIAASYSLRELSADAAATNAYHQTKNLAAAFLKVSEAAWPSPVSAFSPNGDRLNKLLDHSWRPDLHLWRRSYGLTLGLLLAATFGLVRVTQAKSLATPPAVERLCHQTKVMCQLDAHPLLMPATICLSGQCYSFNRPLTPDYALERQP